jgi:hypothetical protein
MDEKITPLDLEKTINDWKRKVLSEREILECLNDILQQSSLIKNHILYRSIKTTENVSIHPISDIENSFEHFWKRTNNYQSNFTKNVLEDLCRSFPDLKKELQTAAESGNLRKNTGPYTSSALWYAAFPSHIDVVRDFELMRALMTETKFKLYGHGKKKTTRMLYALCFFDFKIKAFKIDWENECRRDFVRGNCFYGKEGFAACAGGHSPQHSSNFYTFTPCERQLVFNPVFCSFDKIEVEAWQLDHLYFFLQWLSSIAFVY